MAEESSTPKIIDVAAPSITKHSSTISENLVPSTDKPAQPEIKQVSNIGANIAPVVSEEVAITPPTNSETQPAPVAPVAEQVAEPEEPTPTTVQSSQYEASDSLPDMSQKMTSEMTNEMQAPRIYDTKEYVVPIKDTLHGHGTLGKVLAGIISATVVVGIVLAAAYFLV